MNRKPTIIAVACVWFGSLALAYVVGKSSTDEGLPNAEVGTEDGGSTRNRLSGFGGDRAIDGGSGGAAVERGRGSGDSGDALALLRGSLENSNPVGRMQAFMNALAMLDSDEFGAALDELEEDLRSGENRREISLLLYAWAEQHGAAALEHLDGLELGREGYSFYNSALSAWAGTDPDKAEAWALQKHEGKEGNENYYMVGVINGVAKNDVLRAANLAQGIGFGRARGKALRTVVDELFKKGDEAAMAWIESMGGEDERFRAGAAGHVASEIASKYPEVAGDWVMGLGIEEKDRAIASVAYQWGQSAPEEAATWAAGIEDQALSSRGMETVVESWTRRDADAAGTWLGQMPATPALDRPVRSYALMVQERDPEAAITWANTITDEKMRSDVVQELGSRWLRRSPEAAKAYLKGQEGLPEGLQQRLN